MSGRPLRVALFALALCAAPARAALTPKNRPYDVEHYRIEVSLEAATGQYRNRTTIRLKPGRDLERLSLDAEGLKVLGARLPGTDEAISVEAGDHELTLAFRAPLKAGETVEIAIDTEGTAQAGTRGLVRAQDPLRPGRLPVFYSHFEPDGARRFFPCNDEPADKATSETIVTLDPRYSVLSNGRLVEERLVGEGARRQRRVHWLLERPHSTYLISLVAGQFDTVRSRKTSLPLAVHVAPNSAPQARYALETTERVLQFYEQWLRVPYPWERYDQVGVPGFGGGMENTTQSTMAEGLLVAEGESQLARPLIQKLIAHELAHQWFGDYVTVRWWNDLWLHEGITTFLAELAYAETWGRERASVADALTTWLRVFRQEETPRARPIVSGDLPSPTDLFDPITYDKAARVVRMLDIYVGRNALRRGLAGFLQAHPYGSATTEDLFAELEKIVGKDLGRFREGWLAQPGYPILTAEGFWNEREKQLTLSVAGRTSLAGSKGRFLVPLPLVAHRRSLPLYDTPVLLIVDTGAPALFQVKLPAEPEWLTWNDGEVALAEIETPNTPERQWIAQALKDPTPVSRLAALRHLAAPVLTETANALSTPARETIARALAEESSAAVRAGLLRLLAESPLPTLPAAWAAAVIEQATGPHNLAPESTALDRLTVQAAALQCLGRFDAPEAAALLKARLFDPRLGYDLLGSTAGGWTNLGTLTVLEQAIVLHSKRGPAYRRLLLPYLALLPEPRALTQVAELLESGDLDGELATRLVRNLSLNETFKNRPELPALVERLVLTPSRYDDDLRARLLALLEAVKTPFARTALERIAAAESVPDRLRGLARLQLSVNFPQK